MVDWLAGNRVRGTSTERTTSTGFNDGTPYTGVGGWKELGTRDTLESAGNLMSVTGLPDKRYYMILTDKRASGDTIPNYRLNNDFSGTSGTSGHYSQRVSTNGGAYSSGASTIYQTEANGLDPYNAQNSFNVQYISNLAGKEKLAQGHFTNRSTTTKANAPKRSEFVWKWDNTSDAIDRIDVVNSGTGSFDTGSELVVLGWDEDDTHTTNFWEELTPSGGVTLSGGASDTLDSGTITAKKYLWVQTYIKAVSGTAEPDTRFNDDVTYNYADSYSINGGGDSSSTSSGVTSIRGAGVPYSAFFNDFIINNSGEEKLMTRHLIYLPTSGVSSTPSRRETVGKWCNTSDSITSIKWVEQSGGAGQFDTSSIMKVWGSN